MTKPLLLERQDAIAIIAINDTPYNRMGSPDIQEGMMAFLEKRKPTFNK